MRKKNHSKNLPLYLLTLANVLLGIQKGFSWVTWLAIFLSLAVFVLDWKEGRNGN